MKTSLAVATLLLCSLAGTAAAQPYAVDWRVVAGGGHAPSSAGGFSIQGTFGQHDAAYSQGAGTFSLQSGFWLGALPAATTPTVGSPTAANIGEVSADLGGTVTADGGDPITDRGIVYAKTSENADPTIGGPFATRVSTGGSLGLFTIGISSLAPSTGYSFKAFASNALGTSYSSVATFTTLTPLCPAITLSDLSSTIAGTPYSDSVAATGGLAPYGYAVTSGILTTGLSLNPSTGAVTGTPPSIASSTFEITATDSNGCTGSATYTVAAGSVIAPGNLVIREFRTRGAVSEALDEYVVIHNRTASTLMVAAIDGSAGFAVAASGGTFVVTIPNGTTLAPHANFLAVNSVRFSLGVPYDAAWSTDIDDNAGLALFKSSTQFTVANRLDSAGRVGDAAPYIEGAGLPSLGAITPGQHAWVRKYPASAGAGVTDTQNNATDFVLVAVDAATYGPSAVKAVLGTPTPEGLASARERTNTEVPMTLVEPSTGQNGAYNRAAIPASGGNPAAIELRRRFTNNTGTDIATLRFKASFITTKNSIPAGADLRPVFSSDVSLVTPTNGTVLARGLSLDNPAIHTTLSGGNVPEGGLNSVLVVDLSTLPGGKLAAGATIDVNFRVFVHAGGSFNYWLVPEAKP